MKAFYFILTSIFITLLTSCNPKAFEYTEIINYKIVNCTNKTYSCHITQSIIKSEHSETLNSLVNEHDSISICFTKTAMRTYNEVMFIYSDTANVILYNLSDTTFFSFLQTISFSNINGYFVRNYNDDVSKYTKNSGALASYILKITPELLFLFEKDYSMLEKFPEYYRK